MAIIYKPLTQHTFEALEHLKAEYDRAYEQYRDCTREYHEGKISELEAGKAFEAERLAWRRLDEFREDNFR